MVCKSTSCDDVTPRISNLSFSCLHLPLGAVSMAGVAFVVGFSILEDEAVGTLQAIGTLFHTVWTVFEMKAFHTMLWALRKKKKKGFLLIYFLFV